MQSMASEEAALAIDRENLVTDTLSRPCYLVVRLRQGLGGMNDDEQRIRQSIIPP